MAAEAVEGGASLFRRECVGFGFGMRVHNLSRREEPRAARSASHPQLDTALESECSWCFVGLGSTREVVSVVDRQNFVIRLEIRAVSVDQQAALSRRRPLVNNHLDGSRE